MAGYSDNSLPSEPVCLWRVQSYILLENIIQSSRPCVIRMRKAFASFHLFSYPFMVGEFLAMIARDSEYFTLVRS